MEKPNILLAEDNPINQRVAELMIKKIGYEIDIVSNGQEAIDAIVDHNYRVILMDSQMPVMDGVTSAKWIRENLPADKQPKIFVMSATVTSEARHVWEGVEVDGYIEKPVRVEILKSELDQAMGN